MRTHLSPSGNALAGYMATLGRAPSESYSEDGTDVLIFDPPLTTAEQGTYEVLGRIAATTVPMTTDQYAAVRAQMQILRDLRQMGRNAFMALSAAERDRLIYDALTAQTIIDLAMLRDS